MNLALFHGSERGWLAMQEEGKQPHAPFDLDQIEKAGLNHAFVGHYHRPKDSDWHTYPGNPEPLTFGDGDRAGLVIAEIAEHGLVTRERIDVHGCSLSESTVDLSGCAHNSEARERAREAVAGVTGIVRLVLQGEVASDLDLQVTDLRDLGGQGVVVVPQIGQLTVAYDIDRIAGEQTVRGEFVRQVRDASLDDEESRRVLITGLRALEGRDDLEVL